MAHTGSSGYFSSAVRLGNKQYSSSVANGQIGYLPSLEGLLKDTEIVSTVDLGIQEIPLKKIIGTYSHSRSLAFASNFMPILGGVTEFSQKWIALCNHHLNEGISDPIKVYEYMNWFYVIEGNKRVSVLKYFGAYSISADVIRLIPRKDENDPTNKIYYEFLNFYNITKLNSIWFTKIGSFNRLLVCLSKYKPQLEYGEDKYKHFELYAYNPFRTVYLNAGGQRLPITTGDAFLQYCKIYGLPGELKESDVSNRIVELMKELEFFKKDDAVDILMAPVEASGRSVLSTISTLIKPQKKLKVAFVYARTIEGSGWTYGHELGRRYVEKVLKNQITTSYIENVPENTDAYFSIKKLAEEGNDVIFTTSPVFLKATLKCAMEFTQVKFFNCSEHQPYTHVSNYSGRTFESRFLTGIIAGSMTKKDIIGYVATSPEPGVISEINAFALGAKLVNPYVKVKIAWTNEWNSHIKFTDADQKLIMAGADIISNRNLTVPKKITKKYGVYSMLCTINPDTYQAGKYLAAPIWHWGVFYEKILNNILNDTFKTVMEMFNANSKLINFWWGMASGVLDIYYSKKDVPVETQKLIEVMKKMIKNNDFSPFSGPVYDNQGNLRVEADTSASHEQILTMKWFVDNVDDTELFIG